MINSSSSKFPLQAFLEPFARRLEKAGIERAWREVRLLAAWASDCSYEDILLEQASFSPQAKERLETAVLQREQRKPLTKITQQAWFWNFPFKTTEDTLDPRPESELFISEILRLIPHRLIPLSTLDLGTGTGCLLLSCLAEYPNAHGIGVDISPAAIAVARANAQALERVYPGLEPRATFLQSNWTEGVKGTFDIVMCNPPYVEDSAQLEPEVCFDPPQALFAGSDGLSAFRQLFPSLPHVVDPKTWILLEIGRGQLDSVRDIAHASGFGIDHVVEDLQGIPRILVLRLQKLPL